MARERENAQPKTRCAFALQQQDAVTLLERLPTASAAVIFTDPPYESLEKHRAVGTTTRLKHSKSSSNDWFRVFPNSRFPAFFAAAYRCLARDAHLYVMCDHETAFAIKPMAVAAGFKFWKPIVWDKLKIGMGYHYRSRYEFVLFFEKGRRKLNDLGVPDVLQVPRVFNGYPTEKPVQLAEVFIRQSTSEGQLVVDPFMGSGSTGTAALTLGRPFVGNDVLPDAVATARRRLQSIGDEAPLTVVLPKPPAGSASQRELALAVTSTGRR